MKYELSQRFYFEAAHTLNREFETDASRRIHGHTYHAKLSVAAVPDPHTGMVVDVALLRAEAEKIRAQLDHRLLDEVPGLGMPTLEGLCAYMAESVKAFSPPVTAIEVWREAGGDSCRLSLEQGH